MSNYVMLKRRPFEHNAKFEKRPLVRSEIGIFDIFFKRLCKERFENLQIVIENFKPLPHLIKWWSFKVFVKLYKSPISIANIVKGSAVSGLRQF